MSQNSISPDSSPEPTLNLQTQSRYWLRCLKTLLPTGYQEQDSSRIVLGFFTLTSLDLLGALDDHITPEERKDFITFIYHCQHPGGGFRSFPGTDFGSERTTETNARWDPANVAGTYFALAALVLLGDDLSKVHRKETLSWIRHLQRDDGSFGDIAAGPNGIVDGGQDVRFCFLAALVCVVLGERLSSKENIEENVNVASLTRFILKSQAYDGGIARKPDCESHAGSTYCGIATLRLLERPEEVRRAFGVNTCGLQGVPPEFIHNLIHWLSYRQTTMLYDYNDLEALNREDEDESENDTKSNGTGFTIHNATPAISRHMLDFERIDNSNDSSRVAGLNGRVNKPADTCYSFWAGATLAILGLPELIDREANRRYLLGRTQHKIGGFGKFPGDLPDILHSSLALACLAIHGEPGLKPIDPILCISLDAKSRIDGLAWRNAK